MTRIRAFCIGLFSAFLFLFAGCGQQEFVFPEQDDFDIQIEIISVTEYDEAKYQLQIKTVLQNSTAKNFRVFSGPNLMDLLLNDRYVSSQKDLVLVPYSLESRTAYTEIKTIQIEKTAFIGSQLYIESKFYIEDKNAKKQDYIVKSEVYTLTEEDL